MARFYCSRCKSGAVLYLDLVFTVFFDGFSLAESLQGSVHALVEAPAAMHRDPVQVTHVLDHEQRLDRSLQHTRERHVERQLVRLYHLQQTDSPCDSK